MAAAARHQMRPPGTVPTAQAVPTATGTIAAGRVRGRAPATQMFIVPAPWPPSLAHSAPPPRNGVAQRQPSVVSYARTSRVGQAGPMPDLVAIDLPGGPAFVEALQRTWDVGDAALP